MMKIEINMRKPYVCKTTSPPLNLGVNTCTLCRFKSTLSASTSYNSTQQYTMRMKRVGCCIRNISLLGKFLSLFVAWSPTCIVPTFVGHKTRLVNKLRRVVCFLLVLWHKGGPNIRIAAYYLGFSFYNQWHEFEEGVSDSMKWLPQNLSNYVFGKSHSIELKITIQWSFNNEPL